MWVKYTLIISVGKFVPHKICFVKMVGYYKVILALDVLANAHLMIIQVYFVKCKFYVIMVMKTKLV